MAALWVNTLFFQSGVQGPCGRALGRGNTAGCLATIPWWEYCPMGHHLKAWRAKVCRPSFLGQKKSPTLPSCSKTLCCQDMGTAQQEGRGLAARTPWVCGRYGGYVLSLGRVRGAAKVAPKYNFFGPFHEGHWAFFFLIRQITRRHVLVEVGFQGMAEGYGYCAMVWLCGGVGWNGGDVKDREGTLLIP